jgi:Carboxypeptidase regulatory-like domain
MQLRKLQATLIVVVIPCFFSWGQTQSESKTGIEGIITIAPVRPGPPSDSIAGSKPLANATFTVESERGVVTSFTTDEQGYFRISLAPGHYTISMNDKKGGIAQYGPFDVDVVVGRMTKVEWQCDTGIR